MSGILFIVTARKIPENIYGWFVFRYFIWHFSVEWRRLAHSSVSLHQGSRTQTAQTWRGPHLLQLDLVGRSYEGKIHWYYSDVSGNKFYTFGRTYFSSTNVIGFSTFHKKLHIEVTDIYPLKFTFCYLATFYPSNKATGFEFNVSPKVTLLAFRMHRRTLNTNQSKECEWIMEFSLIHFNVLMQDLSVYNNVNVHGLGQHKVIKWQIKITMKWERR